MVPPFTTLKDFFVSPLSDLMPWRLQVHECDCGLQVPCPLLPPPQGWKDEAESGPGGVYRMGDMCGARVLL